MNYKPKKILQFIIWKLAITILPIIIVIAALTVFLIKHSSDSRLKTIKETERNNITLQAELLEHDFSVPIEDIKYLIEQPAVREVIDSNFNNKAITKAERMLLAFSKWRSRYDQIRIIDSSGKEILRINFTEGFPTVVAKSKLQNKGNREYVRRTLKLRKGNIYISAIDYNIEYGQIEKPEKEVVRFASPIFNSKGDVKSIFIINYYADRILEYIRDISLHSNGVIYLVDSQLKPFLTIKTNKTNNNHLKTVILNNNQNSINVSESIRKAILANEEGQFLIEGNLVTFKKIGIFNNVTRNKALVFSGNSWKLISYVKRETIESSLYDFKIRILVTFFILSLIIIIGGVVIILLQHRSKQASDLLIENRIRFKQLIQTMDEGVILFDRQGFVIFTNKKFSEITGYDYAELIGKHLVNLPIKENRYRLFLKWKKEFQAGEIQPREMTVERSNGSMTLIAIKPSIITDEAGKILGFMGIVKDITKQKAMEEKLHEESQFFQLNPAVLLRANSDGKITFCNPKARSFFGENPVGKKINALTQSKIADDIKKLPPGKSFQFEIQKGNATNLFTVTKNQKGDSTYFYGSDITRLKEANREKLRLLQAVEQSESTIIITDQDQKIIFANKSLEKISGYKLVEVMGKTPSIFRSGLTPKKTYESLDAAIRAGKTWKGEFINRKKDGSLYWEHAVITPVTNDRGEIINFVAVKDDVTNQKEMEIKLKEAKEEAEKANRLKSAFLANMSHEIRTPMNAIIGYTDLLLEKERNTEKRDFLNIIKESGNTLLNLINDILDLSKIEADRMEINSKPFSVIHVLDHIVSMFKYRIEEKGLKLIVDIDKSIPKNIYGDELRFSQIIINFMSNALKFTEKGSITLSAKYKKKKLLVSVSDTGIGIKKEDQKIIFDPFSQLNTTMNKTVNGTGLGLAISKKLAKLMHGNITLKSTFGEGSTFTLNLPIHIANVESEETITEGNKTGLLNMKENSHTSAESEIEKYVGLADKWMRKFEDQEEIIDVLKMGIKKLPRIYKRLEDAVLKQDKEGIRFIAHELKGMSGNLKMDEVYEISKRIEEESNKNECNISTVRNLLVDLKSIIFSIPADFLNNKGGNKGHNLPNVDFKILLAEDNHINQELMKKILEMMHLSCDVAENGEQVLQMLDKEKYDLLLMDIQMPKLDGTQALKKIRKDHRLKGLHIIALTANALKGDAEKYRKMGFDDYVSKPINIPDFKEKLCRLIIAKSESELKPKKRPKLKKHEIEKLRKMAEIIKENLSIFNYDALINLSNEMESLSHETVFRELSNEVRVAANSFNDRMLLDILNKILDLV